MRLTLRTACAWLGLAPSLTLLAPLSRAAEVQGPSADVQAGGPLRINNHIGPNPGQNVSWTREEVSLFAPVTMPTGMGTMLPVAEAAEEQRTFTGPGDANQAKAQKQVSVLGLDLIYFPETTPGEPAIYFGAGRLGSLRLDQEGRPLVESFAGVDIPTASLPDALRLFNAKEVRLRAFVRRRDYPGFGRWLLLGGYRLDWANGIEFDAEPPSHVIASLKIAKGAATAYTGIRWESREYPVYENNQAGWLDGYNTELLIGMRRRLIDPLFVTMEAGLVSELLRFADNHGDTLESHTTPYAPWVRLGVQIWIPEH